MLFSLYSKLMICFANVRDRRDETGAAAVEYGMLVALIAAVIVTTVALLGPEIKAAFQDILTALTGATA